MACTYCYQHHKTENKMTWETIQPFLDELLADKNKLINTSTTTGLILDFIGGEPTLEMELIDRICTYVVNYMLIHNHPWLLKTRISLTTNGLLYFTPEVQNFVNKFGSLCHFGFSIDGDKTLHDMCRRDKEGNGTYDRALAAVLEYTKKTHEPLNTKMTLSPENIRYTANAIIDLVEHGFEQISVNCIYEEGWTYEHATILYNEFKKISDYLIENDKFNKVFIRILDRGLYCALDDQETENWCGGVSDMNLAVDYKGRLFTCIRYMESSLNGHQPELPIGDIATGYLSSDYYKKNHDYMCNITRQSQSTQECLECPVAKGCAWCSAYNYEKFGDINHRATFICPMHRASSLANVYYWNKLYKKFNLPDVFPLLLPEIEIDKIISSDEKELLYQLTRR